MKHSSATTSIARQVELIIRRLDSLSVLPAVAAHFLAELSQPNISTSSLSQIIEADPAMTARILSLAREREMSVSSVAEAVEKLPMMLVRDAILSVKVFQVFDANYDPEKNRPLPRKQLAIHALAVACCAREIAQAIQTEPSIDPQLAFSAGLLHDIGKLAIDEVMPKSFERVVTEAKAAGACAADIERKYLGLDHCIVGKRLAEKWGLPRQIVLAIWLHHSDPDAIAQNMPDARIAQIVRLADNIARACQLGGSGSYDEPECSETMLNALGLTTEHIDTISEKLPKQVAQKTKLLTLDSDRNAEMWCEAIHSAASTMAKDNTKLVSENHSLQTASNLCGFITEFLSGVTSTMPAIDVAAAFASMLQRFYQTGPVCIYLPDEVQQGIADAVIINDVYQTEFLVLKNPPDMPLIPQQIQNRYALLDASEHAHWLFEQLPVPFDSTMTKIAPLVANGSAVGAVVVELRQVVTHDPLLNFQLAARTAAAIIALAKAHYGQEVLSEQFVQTLGQLKQTQEQLAAAQSLQAVAELAAGAAHELNNPLAVISGRAQLLAQVESDQSKKQMLRQIEERTRDISGTIEDLMAFARPGPTECALSSVPAIVNEAISITAKKHNVAMLETKIKNLADLPNVYVDSKQIVTAISHVLSNALEAYPGNNGPIFIAGKRLDATEMVEIEISDRGCGMDGETLRKATLPFFSAKPAGRKRGMGLAQTQRLIQLNNGLLHITSESDAGTTVTITLPCRT
ncbi:MAG: HDOD domain-containing protein [Sedimentisphaerales bacterium]|nr:HDOD domain-containing protein [Sedimentisphaerales bacterium]